MATKYLLTNKNSAWGVIIDRYNGNRYEHVLSFTDSDGKHDEALKWAFIDKFLMNGQDTKKLIKEAPEKAFPFLSALTGKFIVSTAEYFKESENGKFTITKKENGTVKEIKGDYLETVDTLLNKDFLIAYDDSFGVEKYTFWTIVGKVGESKNTVEYTAEKDVYFSRPINEMFKPTMDAKVLRAHTPRVYKNSNGKFLPNLKKDSVNLNSEPIDGAVQQAPAINKKIENIQTGKEYYVYWVIPAREGFIQEDKKVQRYFLFEDYILFNMPDPYSLEIKKRKYALGFKGGYVNQQNSTKIELPQFTINEYDYFYAFAVDSATRNKYKNYFNSIERTNYVIKIEKQFIDTSTLNKNELNIFWYHESDFTTDPVKIPCYTISTILKQTFSYEPFKDFKYNTNINSEFDYKNEGKLWKSIYRPLYLFDTEENKFNLFREYMGAKGEFNTYTSYSPFFSHSVVFPNFIDNNFNIYQDAGDLSFKRGYKFNSIIDKSILRKSDEYQNWLLTNSNSLELNQRITRRDEVYTKLSSMLSIVAGATTLGGGFTGTTGSGIEKQLGAGNVASGTSSILGGIQGYISSADKINSIVAQQNDLKNTPNKILGNANNEILVNKFSNFSIVLMEDQLLPELESKIGQHFHIFGVNYNEKWMPLNNLLTTNYYFNYIQAEAIFENFADEVSGPERQIIQNSMANGIWIWHVRDLETFKGIKNFNVNNVEMEFYEK